jgi:hypothetical protein
VNAVTGELVIDCRPYIDADRWVSGDARKLVGKVLGAAPRGAVVHVELGNATGVDGELGRALASFAPRHPIVVRGSDSATVSRVVRRLRGEPDDLLGGVA